jgi:hypothetical protein
MSNPFFDEEKLKGIPKHPEWIWDKHQLPEEWTGLMTGFIPTDKPDYSSTGTFDQGGPSLDNKQWEDPDAIHKTKQRDV